MAGKRKAKASSGGGGGAPLWVVTFGDLMSLLLTFFVLILSFSSVQDVEFQKALGSLKGALSVLPKNGSVVAQVRPYYPHLSPIQQTKYKRMAKELKDLANKIGYEKSIQMEVLKDGLIIRIDSPVLFDLGEATLKSQSFVILDKVIEMTAPWLNNIRVEGHTDDLPISTARFPSNWELSTERALSVLRYFLHSGQVEPSRLAAVGYGQYHPLVPNNNDENRARNRRVEIYIEGPEQKVQFTEDVL